MAKLYGLTEADLKVLKADRQKLHGGGASQRPLPKRRRSPGSGPSLSFLLGRLEKDVPARTKIEDGCFLEVWEGSWYVGKTDENNGPIEIGAINRSYQSIRASANVPIAVWGLKRSYTDQEQPPVTHEYLEILMPLDLASLPGFELQTWNSMPQAPYHHSGSRDHLQDGGACAAGGN